MELLRCENLAFDYGGGEVLKNISLSFEKGQVTAVLGENGAGKSTLFLCLNGVLKKTRGEIYFEDKPLDFKGKGRDNPVFKIGIVFQNPDDQLFCESVFDDIAFGVLNKGIKGKEAEKAVLDAAERLGITELLSRPVHALSYGQKKRVAIAGVLAMGCSLLILDEPTAGLDPKGASELLNLIKTLKKEGKTVIISTHDIDSLPDMCDYIYVMQKGEIVSRGTCREVLWNEPLLKRANLAPPKIVELFSLLERRGIQAERAMTAEEGALSIERLLTR